MTKQAYSLLFSVGLLLLFSYAAWEATNFNELARFFPLYISLAAVLLTFILVLQSMVAFMKARKVQQRSAGKAGQEKQEQQEEKESVLRYMLWFIGYVAIIYVFGFMAATILFLFAFLRIETKYNLTKTVISIAIVYGLIQLFSSVMTLYWPEGVIPIFQFLN